MSKRRLAWRYICHFDTTPFKGKQLMQAVEMSKTQTQSFIRLLLKQGRIALYDKGDCFINNRYQLVDRTPPTRPNTTKSKRPCVRQRIWNSCRIMKRFSLFDVRSTAMAGRVTTTRYLRALEKASFVRRIDVQGEECYRLNLNSGAQHPEIRKDGVYCPNRQVLYPFKEEA
ncbi:hypothetical protein [Thaumasiovibrio sp. DFM-14]|uniref:hypothetical protein n=1 Tax=Thaumasiovibrio sp. DFM-14 TaxID=3384792 RepID=UPI00399F26EB